ncbi:hypothetical protein CDD81_7957 [Ophiocordyceps australis]|uniref:Glycoside hydrolase family 3 N-terminal domain-containing protein n=1 Tax=Ophiocordyceps australis TaxID=1399860 RepID=A0A2C5Y2C8_9HYPO|nr:hypothetical protein CDD81_7957 [Ophiocordyceps australis]
MAFASLVLAACVAVALAPWAGLGASFASVAYYPAPHGGWVTEWTESYDKARSMVAKMTLAEKANLTGGTGVFMG